MLQIALVRLVFITTQVLVKNYRGGGTQVFVMSIVDINKALCAKVYTDLKKKLPSHFYTYLLVFDQKVSKMLLSLRRPRVNHRIELEKDKEDQELEVLQGLLYNMLQDKLLVLRKTLSELLDKGFIRVNSSLVVAPILFVRKLEGRLRFCVDYQALNRLTYKD